MQYDYVKSVNVDRLSREISDSAITIAQDHISLSGTALSIFFKAELDEAELSVLEAIVLAHENIALPENVVSQVSVVELPDPQPFAAPTYRTKRNATTELVTVAAGGSADIDFLLTDERYVTGGALIVKNPQIGDYITASVYDGYMGGVIPEPSRASICEAWPVVALYIEKEWIKIDSDGYTHHEINTYPLNAKISAGLILRVTYHAVNSGSDRVVALNYNLTKKL